MNKKMADMTYKELEKLCTCQDEEYSCEACSVSGALMAGIPRSVIKGETKLSDHFSESYINHMCNRQPDFPEEK